MEKTAILCCKNTSLLNYKTSTLLTFSFNSHVFFVLFFIWQQCLLTKGLNSVFQKMIYALLWVTFCPVHTVSFIGTGCVSVTSGSSFWVVLWCNWWMWHAHASTLLIHCRRHGNQIMQTFCIDLYCVLHTAAHIVHKWDLTVLNNNVWRETF